MNIFSQVATCLPNECFCEAVRVIGIMQPVNAFSSLVLALVGLVILGTKRTFFSIAIGLSAILVGLGSYFYHAHLTLWGQAVDNLGMYLVVLAPIVLLLQRRFAFSRNKAIAFFLLFAILCLGVAIVYTATRRYELAVLILVMLLLDHAWVHTPRKNLWIALGIFAVSFIIWSLDVTKLICAPQSIWQGHAIWHVLNAVSVFFLYRHYREA